MNTYRFLVDVNLPKFFAFFNRPEFTHVVDLDRSMSDEQIWEYAVRNKLVILTKDTDFYFKCLVANQSTKVVYFKIGNLRIKELYAFFTQHWLNIVEKLAEAKLLIVEKESITVVITED
jgi:predicted nuclease of predicted toxin-antitoxin system